MSSLSLKYFPIWLILGFDTIIVNYIHAGPIVLDQDYLKALGYSPDLKYYETESGEVIERVKDSPMLAKDKILSMMMDPSFDFFDEKNFPNHWYPPEPELLLSRLGSAHRQRPKHMYFGDTSGKHKKDVKKAEDLYNVANDVNGKSNLYQPYELVQKGYAKEIPEFHEGDKIKEIKEDLQPKTNYKQKDFNQYQKYDSKFEKENIGTYQKSSSYAKSQNSNNDIPEPDITENGINQNEPIVNEYFDLQKDKTYEDYSKNIPDYAKYPTNQRDAEKQNIDVTTPKPYVSPYGYAHSAPIMSSTPTNRIFYKYSQNHPNIYVRHPGYSDSQQRLPPYYNSNLGYYYQVGNIVIPPEIIANEIIRLNHESFDAKYEDNKEHSLPEHLGHHVQPQTSMVDYNQIVNSNQIQYNQAYPNKIFNYPVNKIQPHPYNYYSPNQNPLHRNQKPHIPNTNPQYKYVYSTSINSQPLKLAQAENQYYYPNNLAESYDGLTSNYVSSEANVVAQPSASFNLITENQLEQEGPVQNDFQNQIYPPPIEEDPEDIESQNDKIEMTYPYVVINGQAYDVPMETNAGIKVSIKNSPNKKRTGVKNGRGVLKSDTELSGNKITYAKDPQNIPKAVHKVPLTKKTHTDLGKYIKLMMPYKRFVNQHQLVKSGKEWIQIF